MKRRLIEHYEVTRKLGAGGSGVVYLANDTLLMRPVVLKILKRGSLTIEQMRSTVLREARLASAIEHPNVCAIYEVGESEDEAYIVMQYVPGESLDKIIANGAASVQLGLSVGIQIADGLSAAHRLGIFHRDLNAHREPKLHAGRAVRDDLVQRIAGHILHNDVGFVF